MNYAILTVVIVLLGLAIWCMYIKPPQTEGFAQVLGALGPYRKQIAQAIDNSNQQSADLRLQPQNNFNAGEYTWSTFTQMRKNGVPPHDPQTDLADCKKQCQSDDPLSSQKCVSMCSCRVNVIRHCQENVCPYSKLDKGYCMQSCIANNSANCNNFSWTRGWGGSTAI
jgi:hypothetical protein